MDVGVIVMRQTFQIQPVALAGKNMVETIHVLRLLVPRDIICPMAHVNPHRIWAVVGLVRTETQVPVSAIDHVQHMILVVIAIHQKQQPYITTIRVNIHRHV